MDIIGPGTPADEQPIETHVNDGLDNLNVDIESAQRTRQVLGDIAATGIRFDDGNLETLTMKRLVIEDRAILYTQRYEPRCHFCCHPLRDQAEALWLETGRNVTAVQRFFEEHDGPKSWDSVNNHLESHCDWTLGSAVNFLVRVRSNEPDLNEIAADDIGFSIKALNQLVLDVGRFSVSDDYKQTKEVADAISKILKAKKDFIQLESDLYGAHARAEARIQAQTQRVMDFLRKLLSVVSDQEQKGEILRLMDEFRKESSA